MWTGDTNGEEAPSRDPRDPAKTASPLALSALEWDAGDEVGTSI
jgi:hypothetical protein